jgi:hypothetical protein
VLLLWGVVWRLSRPDPRNNPQTLLAIGNGHASIDLPGLPEPKINLTQEDIAFGELQVERMVKDRPEMGRYVTKTDPVWKFCARAFAGEAIGERIFWESSLPTGREYQSDHQDPYQGQKGNIRIRKQYASGDLAGTGLSCEELWSCAVFEIENLRNHAAFIALFESGLQGKLSREEWIREHTKLEYGALRRTAAQHQKLWQPMAEARGIRSSSEYWGIDVPNNYESWISLYTDPKGYPWDAYGRWYDREILPYARWNKR